MKRLAVIFGTISMMTFFGVVTTYLAGAQESAGKGPVRVGADTKKNGNNAAEDKPMKDDQQRVNPESGLKYVPPVKPGNQAEKFRMFMPLATSDSTVLKSNPLRGPKHPEENFHDSMPTLKPDPNTDYKILVMKPDPNIDYKIGILGRGIQDKSEIAPNITPEAPSDSPDRKPLLKPREEKQPGADK